MREIKNKTKQMTELESEHGVIVEELLRKVWVDDGLNRDEACAFLCISPVTLKAWLEKAGIWSRRLELERYE